MIAFVVALLFTLGVSAFCSVLEALILSTSTAEIEDLKNRSPRKGNLLEKHKMEIEETISTILTLNTIANTAGATAVGALAAKLFDQSLIGFIMGGLTLGILIFSEVIPKNIGVAYRRPLQPHVVYPLWIMRIMLRVLTYFCELLVRVVIRKQDSDDGTEEEIKLLAHKGAKDGLLDESEVKVISNALAMDDIEVESIMTPRTVLFSLSAESTIGEVLQAEKIIPFARIPVYQDNGDNIVGIVRRRDLLLAKARDEDDRVVSEFLGKAIFIPDTSSVSAALKKFLTENQQLAMVVDEYGAITGVLSMEDVMEHILGREIFEKDDVAVDMRQHARNQLNDRRSLKKSRPVASPAATEKPAAGLP